MSIESTRPVSPSTPQTTPLTRTTRSQSLSHPPTEVSEPLKTESQRRHSFSVQSHSEKLIHPQQDMGEIKTEIAQVSEHQIEDGLKEVPQPKTLSESVPLMV